MPISLDRTPVVSFGSKISARFAAALPYKHDIVVLCQVWSGGRQGQLLGTLPIESGEVSVDRTAAIRRTCTLKMTDATGTLVPHQGTASMLTPYGNEVHLFRGIVYPNGDVEYIALGVFGIEDVSIDDTGGNLDITVHGMDRARVFQRFTLRDAKSISPLGNVGGAIQQFLSSLPTNVPVTFNFTPTPYQLPGAPIVYQAGTDPWKSMQDLATAAGSELFFDVNGNCTLQPIGNPVIQTVSWGYNEGSVMIATELNRGISRATGANVVIRDGQGSGVGPPVRGIVMDIQQASPTYVGGPYGQQIDYSSSNLYATQAQAQVAAQAAFNLLIGSIEQLTIKAIPKPDTDVGDVIKVTRSRLNLAPAFYVIDRFTMGLTPEASLDATCRGVTRVEPVGEVALWSI